MLPTGINHHPHSSEENTKSPRVPLLIIGGAFLIGIIFMMIVNRTELRIVMSQFAALWSIEQNRPEIVRLCFKIALSGVVFAALGLAAYLVIYAMQHYRQEEKEESVAIAPVPLHAPSAILQNTRRQALQAGMQERYRVPLSPAPRTAERNAFSTRQETSFLPLRVAQPAKPLRPLSVAPMPETISIPTEVIQKDTSSHPREPGTTLGLVMGDTILVKENHLNREIEQKASNEQVLASQPSAEPEEGQILITLTLLKTVTMKLHAPDSTKTYPVTLDDLSTKALQLIAYIARHQGRKVNLGDMRNDVFGSDDTDFNQVQEALNTAKREIRRRISQTVERAKDEQKKDVFPPDLDIFALQKKKYWLPEYCRVTDLAEIEKQHQIIDQAENSNQLVNSVPEHVYIACKALINAYTGDFLEELLKSDIYAFDPPMDSWARVPFTQFRDYYLQAILYAAEYERKRADLAKAPAEQREHYNEAGRLFALGAMAACNKEVCDGLFDTKVFFKSGRRHGAHVLLSEQLIRRAIALYGNIGSTIVVKRAYATYEQQMAEISNKAWVADPETLKDLDAALQQTGAYRFPETIASPADLSGSDLVAAESA